MVTSPPPVFVTTIIISHHVDVDEIRNPDTKEMIFLDILFKDPQNTDIIWLYLDDINDEIITLAEIAVFAKGRREREKDREKKERQKETEREKKLER